MKKLGTITIGQAPRTDITPILEANLSNTEIVQIGVLDGLSKEYIETKLYPMENDYVLTSRLVTGESVIMSREKIKPILQEKIHHLEDMGITQLLLLCTGVFPGLTTRKSHLIEPDHIIPPTIAALIGKRKLGVIVPLENQVKTSYKKYSPFGLDPVFQVASPYEMNPTNFEKATQNLKKEVDVILLDCMGYTEEMRGIVEKESDIPVVLSNAIMTKLVSEII